MDEKIYVAKTIEITTQRAFYIRSHYTARPFTELFRHFVVDKEEQKLNQRLSQTAANVRLLEFSKKWQSLLKPKCQGLGIDWNLVSLNAYKMNKIPETDSHLLEGIVKGPDFFAWGKTFLLEGLATSESIKVLESTWSRLIKDQNYSKIKSAKVVASKIAFWDWNAGMISLTISLDTDEFKTYQNDLGGMFINLLDTYYFGLPKRVIPPDKPRHLADKIGEALFSTCTSLFGDPPLRHVPAKDGQYVKAFMDYGYFCVLACRKSRAAGYKQQDKLLWQRRLERFVSVSKEDRTDKSIAGSPILFHAAGFGGCSMMILTQFSDHEATVLRAKYLCAISLFYYSGLSKLKSRLLDLKLLVARTSKFEQFKGIPEIRRFPAFHLRASSYMNEAVTANITDGLVDHALYQEAWRGLGAVELTHVVQAQLDHLSQYVSQRNDSESAKRANRWEINIAILTIFFTLLSLAQGGGDYLWDKKCISNWFDSHSFWKILLVAAILLAPILIFRKEFFQVFKKMFARNSAN